jgi:L-lactate permease
MDSSKNKRFIGFIATTAIIFLIGLVLNFAGINGVTGSHGFPALITFILAFMPILLVLIGMLIFGLPGMRVAPAAFVLAVLLSFTYFMNSELGFNGEASAVWAQTWSGLKSAFFIVGLIFFSFLILDMMQTSGAMEIVTSAIAAPTMIKNHLTSVVKISFHLRLNSI